jgi:hypothetical protein
MHPGEQLAAGGRRRGAHGRAHKAFAFFPLSFPLSCLARRSPRRALLWTPAVSWRPRGACSSVGSRARHLRGTWFPFS